MCPPSDVSPSPLATGLIQYFPCEILSEILLLLDFRSITFATLVCQRWYYASTNHAEIWERIELNSTDVYRPNIVRRVLARSGDQPLALQIRLSVPNLEHEQPRMDDYWALQHLMRDVVKEHLDHCYRLLISAPQVAWPVIIDAVAGADFSVLGGLYLQNNDAVAQWQLEAFSSLADYNVVQPSELVFPLPKNRRVLLWEAHLQGVSLGDANYCILKNLKIQNAMDFLVVDGRLDPRLFNRARHLTIDGICVPALEVPSTPTELSPGNLQHLVLSELVAMPDSDEEFSEHDCTGFFAALNTSSLLTLSIDAWEFDGRIWNDLLHFLWASTAPKFPCVYMLKLRRMDFIDEEMELIAGFLDAFPALQTLFVEECCDAWEDIIHVLELIPSLCGQLDGLIVDHSIVIFRDDPLPFRSSVFSDD